MKTQHTPGPWHVSESGSIEFEDGYLGEAYDFNGTDKTDLPMMANARLMAAAPELLEMVKQLSDIVPRIYDDEKRLYLEAKALITKLTEQ